MELGFQLYSARFAPSLEDTLRTIAEIGYTHVEPYGDLYVDVSVLAEGMHRHGLKARSGHFALIDLERDRPRMIAAAEALGIETIIVPAIPVAERDKSVAGWRAFGARLETLADAVAHAGKRLAWHNHDFEFVTLDDGSVPLDQILEYAPSLSWQADLAWVASAGREPWPMLDRHATRVVSVHLKDLARAGECADEDGWADFDHGTLDWKGHWSALGQIEPSLRVVEHDKPSDVFRFARRAFAAAVRLEAAGAGA